MINLESMRFQNQDGRLFSIRLLRKNEYYGDDDAFLYNLDEPSVEFFDASGFDTQENSEILGYFTGIRCVISEIFSERAQRSLPFSEHLAVWSISDHNLAHVQQWIAANLSELEKEFIRDLPFLPVSKKATETPVAKPRKTAVMPISPPRAHQDILEERHVLEVGLPAQACADPLDSCERSASFLQQQLEAALRTLDIAETAESDNKAAAVQVRLHILDAKRQVLKALGLLYKV